MLCCKTGVPARMLIYQDSAFMLVLREGEVTIVDLETQMRSKTQVDFQLCPVSSHNQHGLVESKINVIQQGLKKIDAGSTRVCLARVPVWEAAVLLAWILASLSSESNALTSSLTTTVSVSA
jgi:hypothetical protein